MPSMRMSCSSTDTHAVLGQSAALTTVAGDVATASHSRLHRAMASPRASPAWLSASPAARAASAVCSHSRRSRRHRSWPCACRHDNNAAVSADVRCVNDSARQRHDLTAAERPGFRRTERCTERSWWYIDTLPDSITTQHTPTTLAYTPRSRRARRADAYRHVHIHIFVINKPSRHIELESATRKGECGSVLQHQAEQSSRLHDAGDASTPSTRSQTARRSRTLARSVLGSQPAWATSHCVMDRWPYKHVASRGVTPSCVCSSLALHPASLTSHCTTDSCPSKHALSRGVEPFWTAIVRNTASDCTTGAKRTQATAARTLDRSAEASQPIDTSHFATCR
jgi:hypothetical protein